MPSKPSLSLKGRALALLAQREHSASELRRKLLRHAQAAIAAASAGHESMPNDDHRARQQADAAGQIDEVMTWLRDHDYLSEARFVESRVHARAARYGNLRIRQELAQHGLALPPEAANALKSSELERATEVWRRKFGGSVAAHADDRARQARFLAQRGFSPETIARVLREAGRARISHDEPDCD